MRLADVILRRGHLSENALVEVWSTGVRPSHLDRCDICAERAVDMSRWLEDVRDMGAAEADAVFPEERLAAQRSQVLQRLESLDRPAKVISFPARAVRHSDAADRRVSPGWLAAAAAAGLAIGIVSIELSHSFETDSAPTTQVADGAANGQPSGLGTVIDASILEDDPYSRTQLGSLEAMDEMTPRLIDVVAIKR
ncbi:MAG: hypothetical protein IPL75_15130 [Acidobacteria bacterium]|nr:hypothetical protein [Acidobacteriota bacterium]